MMVAPSLPRTDRRSSLVELEDISVVLDGRTVLRDVSAQIWPGEFIGVIGPNGSGKSTILRVLLGLIHPTTGKVRIHGQPDGRAAPAIGYCPQDRSFDRDLPLTGREFVGLGLDGHRWGIGWPNRARREKVDAALDAVNGRALAAAPIGRMSGGERQRLSIAQALIGDPALLLLDEPLASLDLRSQRDIISLVDRLRRERNVAVLFVTHGVNPLLGVMDRVWYLAGGHAAIGTVGEVIRSDVLSRLYGAHIDVVEVQGRVFVSSPDECDGDHHGQIRESS